MAVTRTGNVIRVGASLDIVGAPAAPGQKANYSDIHLYAPADAKATLRQNDAGGQVICIIEALAKTISPGLRDVSVDCPIHVTMTGAGAELILIEKG